MRPGVDTPHDINGVLQAVTHDRIEDFIPNHDVTMHKLSHEHLTAISWQSMVPTDVPIYMFAPNKPVPATRDFPLLQSIVDVQMKGGLVISPAFAQEMVHTTHWSFHDKESPYWLNDREVPRRPWVHTPQYATIDAILKAYPPSDRNVFDKRQLEQEFSIHFWNDPKQEEGKPIDDPQQETLPPVPALDPLPQVQDQHHGDIYHDCLPADFIFGFGSLINTVSRTSTDPKALSALPVRISEKLGYQRCWNFQSSTAKLTALGVRKVPEGEKGSTINGVVVPVWEDMVALDKREAGYTRIPIPLDCIEFLSWKQLPSELKTRQHKAVSVWMYVPNSKVEGEPAGMTLDPASSTHPILQTYVDVCLKGCLEFSPAFAREFIQTTAGWSQWWLNDRPVPRRPWIHEPQYAVIDQLLADHLPHGQHGLRKMSVAYAAHMANKQIVQE